MSRESKTQEDATDASPRGVDEPVVETEREPSGDEFPGVNEILGTFMSEASLWPVLIVALGSGGAFGAAILVLAFVDRNPFAMGALVLVAGMTIDVGIRGFREPGFAHLARFVALIWISAFAFTGLAIWSGLADG